MFPVGTIAQKSSVVKAKREMKKKIHEMYKQQRRRKGKTVIFLKKASRVCRKKGGKLP